MELQQPGVVVGFGAALWKSKIISVDDSSAVLRRGDGRGVSCFEADNNKNYNVPGYKYKSSSEEGQDDTHDSLSSSSLVLVWSGQPNEDDDDDNNQPGKRLKPSCTTFVNLNLNKDDEEGPSDHVVGWPPIKSWRKKLLYQHHAPQHRHQNNARRARKDNGLSNMIPLLPRKITKKMRTATTRALS